MNSLGAYLALRDGLLVTGESSNASIYQQSGGVWTLVQSLSPAEGLKSPSAASVSGTTIAFGTYTDNSDAGIVQIYDKSGGTWTLTQNLTGSGTPAAAYFGYSVALDGNRLAIGARNTNVQRGAIYVFNRSAGTWSQAQVLTASDAAANDGLGWSVGLVGDQIVAGAAGKTSSTGAAYLFTRNGSTWSQTMRLPVSGLTTGNEFGRTLAYSGTVAVVMAPNYLGTRGAGFVYEFPVISTAPTLTSITVTPANPSVAAGLTQQFTATGNYSDGSTANLTASATWTSATTSTATINASGLATTVVPGTSQITATFTGISGNTTLTVTPAALVSIAVTPANPSVAAGLTQQFTATGTYTNGTTQNLTATVTWASVTASVATINASGLATTVAPGTSQITAMLGSISGSTTLTVTPAALVSIAVTPANPSVAAGLTQQFTATGTYTNGTTQNLTATVTWASVTASAATINASGLATTVAPGTSQITATLGSITGSTTLTVTPAALVSIAVTPVNPTVTINTSQQFTATGTYSNGTTQNITSTVTWTSSSTPVATIASGGLANAAGPGQSTITATLGAITGSTVLTAGQGFAHTAEYLGGAFRTYRIASTNGALTAASLAGAVRPEHVAVSPNGKFVFATDTNLNRVHAFAVDALTGTLTPVNGSPFAPGGTSPIGVQVEPTGRFLYVPVSGAIAVFSIDAASGVLSPIVGSPFPGTPNGYGVAIDPTGRFLYHGDYFLGVAGYSLNTTTGAVSPLAGFPVATGGNGYYPVIDPAGKFLYVMLHGLNAVASFTINTTTGALTAIAGSPFAAGTRPVYGAIDPAGKYLYVANQDSNNVSAFTINSSSGVLTPVAGAPYPAGTQPLQVAVEPSGKFVYVTNYGGGVNGYSLAASTGALTASPGSPYTSGAAPAGIAFTAAPNSATLTALAIIPANPTMPVSSTLQLLAVGTYSDNSTRFLTDSAIWNSATPSIATISNTASTATAAGNKGLVTSLTTLGTSQVSAAFGGFTASTTVTVGNPAPTLVSIAVTPANPSVALGLQQQFTATGTYSDASTQNITASVTWSSSILGNATINSAGLASTVAQGTSTITATLGAISGNTTLTILPPALVSIAVTPANASMTFPGSQPYTATGTYTNGTTANITSSVTWTSLQPTVATITASGGVATAVAAGTTTIRATLGTIVGSTGLTVTGPALVSIAVLPLNPALPLNAKQQFTALGTFSDGSTSVLTSVLWTTSQSTVASITTAGSSTVLSHGTSVITATVGTIAGSSTITTAGTVAYAARAGVRVNAVNGSTGAFTPSSFRAGVTFKMEATPNGKFLYAPDFVNGTVEGFTLDAVTGAVSRVPGSPFTAGMGAQAAAVDPTGRFVYVINTGAQNVSAFRIDAASGALTPVGTYATGLSPWKGVVDLTGRYLYVLNLDSNSISVFGINQSTGALSTAVSVTGNGLSVARDLAIHPGGKFLYVANSAGTVSVFANADTGALTPVGTPVNAGTFPISIAMDPAGRYLYVGNQTSANVSGYRIDATTGGLTPIVGSPFAIAGGVAYGLRVDPAGRYLYVADRNSSGDAIQGFTIDAGTGSLTAAAASPYAGVVSGEDIVLVAATSAATLTGLQLVPAAPVISTAILGRTLPLAVEGIYSDGSRRFLTDSASWSVLNPGIATVGNTAATTSGGGDKGLATSVAYGATSVTAAFGGFTATGTLTVAQPALLSIAVTPATSTIGVGTVLPFTAMGTFADGSIVNISSTVVWTSSNNSVASLSGNAATAVAPGPATITATSGSVSAPASLTVVAAPVSGAAAGFAYVANAGVRVHAVNGSTGALTPSSFWANPAFKIEATPNGKFLYAPNFANGTVEGFTLDAVTGGLSRVPGSPFTAGAGALGVAIDKTSQFVYVINEGGNSVSAFRVDGINGALTPVGTYPAGLSPWDAIVDLTGRYLYVLSRGNHTLIVFTINQTTGALTAPVNITGNGMNVITDLALDPTGKFLYVVNSVGTVSVFANADTGALTPVGTPVSAGTFPISIAMDPAGRYLYVGNQTSSNVSGYRIAPGTGGLTPLAGSPFAIAGGVTYGLRIDPAGRYLYVADRNPAGDAIQGFVIDAATGSLTAGSASPYAGVVNGTDILFVRSPAAATLTGLQIVPVNPNLPVSSTLQLAAVGTYSDSSTRFLTDSATWNSATPSIATIGNTASTTSAAGNRGLVTSFTTQGTSQVSAVFGGFTASGTVTVGNPAPALVSIAVTPANPSVALGLTRQFTATGTYSDNSTQNITATVTWSSLVPGNATIDNAGLASTVAQGTSVITATLGSVSGNTTLTILPAALVSIAVTPANASMTFPGSQQYTATGTYTNGTTAVLSGLTWTSTTGSVASVSSTGLVSALATGTTNITATLSGITGSTGLTVTGPALVSIAVSPINPTVQLNAQQQFTATGTFANGSTAVLTGVVWSSSQPAVAPITAGGLVTVASHGTSVITATVGTISGASTLTTGGGFLYLANGNVFVNAVNGSTGALSGVSYQSGTTYQMTATPDGKFLYGVRSDRIDGYMLDGNTGAAVPLAWSPIMAGTSNAGGKVDRSGKFLYVADYGASVVRAFRIDAVSGALTPVAGSPFATGGSNPSRVEVEASGKYLYVMNAASSGISAFSIDASTGALTAVAGSPFTGNGLGAPNAMVIEPGGKYLYVTNRWTTSISAFVINASGALAAVAGSPFTAAANPGVMAVDPTGKYLYVGNSDGAQSVTGYRINTGSGALTPVAGPPTAWSVSALQVDPTGRYLYGAAGSGTRGFVIDAATGTLTAAQGSPYPTQGGYDIVIVGTAGSATLTGLELVPAAPVLTTNTLGRTMQLAVQGVYSDGSRRFLTDSANWSMPNNPFATIGNTAATTSSGGNKGLATSVAYGQTTVTATFGGFTATGTLTVAQPALVSIAITPASPTILEGTVLPFTATGTYSDGSTANLTATVTWSSSDTTKASMTANSATALSPGSTTISATSGSVTGATTLGVVVNSVGGSISRFLYLANGNVFVNAVNGSTGALSGVSYQSGTTYQMTATPDGKFLYGVRSDRIDGYMLDGNTGAAVPLAWSPIMAGTSNAGGKVDRSGKFLYVADYGASVVRAFRIDAVSGALTPVAGSPFATGGSNPSRVEVEASGKYLYVMNAASSGISAFSIDASTGALTAVAGSPFTGNGLGAPNAMVIEPGGKYLYVTNRWTTSISAFVINASGALAAVAGSPFTAAANPGVMAVDPTGKYLYVGNSDGAQSVTGYRINTGSGALTPVAGPPIAWSVSALQVDPTGRYLYGAAGSGTQGFVIDAATGTLTAAQGSPYPTQGGYDIVIVGTAGSATLTGLELVPAAPVLTTNTLGRTMQLAVQGVYSDGSRRFLTDSANWSMPNNPFATIGNTAATTSSGGNKGLATSVAYGQTTVTATFGGFTATGTLTVAQPALVSIAITPASPTILEGTVLPFTATGTYSDGSTANLTATVTWSSSDTTKASMTANSATALSPGSTTISATSGSVTGATTLGVVVNSVGGSISRFLYLANGNVFVNAVNGSTGALSGVSYQSGTTYQMTATPDGKFLYGVRSDRIDGYMLDGNTGAAVPLAWSPIMAGTSNAGGKVDRSGKFLYVADYGASVVRAFRIDAVSGALTPVAGSPFATGGSNPSRVEVEASGKYLYVMNAASSGISAFSIDASTGALTAVAGSPFTGNGLGAPNAMVIEPGGKYLYVTNRWTTSISAFVINASGALAAVAGSPFTAAANPGVMAVDPTGKYLYVGNSDGAQSVTGYRINTGSGALTPVAGPPIAWSVSALQVDPTGRYLYGAAGSGTQGFVIDAATGTLTAAQGSPYPTQGGYDIVIVGTAGSATLTGLELVPAAPVLTTNTLGRTMQLAVQGVYSDGSRRFLTDSANWSMPNNPFATIGNTAATTSSGGNKGLATSVAYGQTTVTATFGGFTTTGTLTVAQPALVSIAITPATFTSGVNTTVPFAATGTYVDGSTADLTATATWTSSDTTVATMAANVATTLTKVGTTTITATLSGVSGAATLTVQ